MGESSRFMHEHQNRYPLAILDMLAFVSLKILSPGIALDAAHRTKVAGVDGAFFLHPLRPLRNFVGAQTIHRKRLIGKKNIRTNT